MFRKEFISNLVSISAVAIYSMSLTDIITMGVLLSALILNIVTIIQKLKSKDKI